MTESSSPQIWIEPAEDGFVDHDENLEEGEILVKAVKAFSANQDNDDKKFLCAGALIQRPPSPTSTDVNMTIYDAWMADAIMDGNGGPNLQIQGAMGILDELYRHFLSTDNRNMPAAFVVQCGRATSEYTCASYNAALSRGFRPVEEFITQEDEKELSVWYGEIVDGLVLDPALGIERYTNAAFYHRGTLQGGIAHVILGHMPSFRNSFAFQCDGNFQSTHLFEELDARSTVAMAKEVLPSSVVSDVNHQLRQIERAGLLEFELDSVDNFPSQHISLMSKGRSVVEEGTQAASILSLVEPYIENELLSKVQNVTHDTNIEVSDIFLRTYGPIEDSSDDKTARYKLDAHHDCFNFATAVIALDDVASNGTQGLYALLKGANGENGCSHSALRRYFPLATGDAVMHSWRVKHGVEIPENQKRASLVIWFSRGGNGEDHGDISFLPPPPTWLAEGARSGDDVAQFVLASAMESLSFYCDTNDISFNDIQTWSLQELHPHNLLINSAMQGNADALTRLGTLCREREMSSGHGKMIEEVLMKLRPAGAYGRLDSDPLELGDIMDDDGGGGPASEDVYCWRLLARMLWFEAALRGNSSAQIALADEAIESTFLQTAEELLMAKTFYTLAAQQGDDAARAALSNMEKLMRS